jgi:transcription factor 1
LKFYGKSLEKHKGCDILDINPGAGLWSQKLHEFLQPRSHILLEPNSDSYQPFLEPLVNAPNSKYKLVHKDTTDLRIFRELIDEGVFPDQKLVNPHDGSAQELNTTLLVTGMLVWDPRLPGMSFDSMAKQLFNHFASAVRTNDLFHAYGRVRTLFWVSADDFKPMLAESSAVYSKNNCILEMTHEMEQVVGAPRTARGSGKAGPGRSPQYEIESTIQAMQRARENDMVLPPHRQDKIHSFAAEIEELTGGTGQTGSTWLHEYLIRKHQEGNTPMGLLSTAFMTHADHEKALQEKYPDIDLSEIGNARDSTKRRVGSFWTNRPDHPGRQEVTEFSLQKAGDRGALLNKEKLEAVTDIGQEIYDCECRALATPDGPEKEALLAEIKELNAKWESGIKRLPANYRAAPVATLDDRLSLRSPPFPRIQYDRRAFEPLIMQPNEAWPPNRLSLISTTPFSRPEGQTVDWYEWVQDFVFALFTIPSDSLPTALDKMQHGASQIMQSCPSLTDISKGGRMDLKHLRVRMLTAEMIEELVSAYRDWPFKEPGSDHNRYFRYRGGSNRADMS